MKHNAYRLTAKHLDIDKLLDGRPKKWLIDKLEMSDSTFYWKLNNGFSPVDIERIMDILGG